MSSFDPVAVNALKEAQRMSDMLNEAERAERIAAEQDKHLNRVLSSIRQLDLDPSKVRQILSTTGCQMNACGFSESDVKAVETAGDVL